MHVTEEDLAEKYNLVKLNVISSTAISNRITAVIESLQKTTGDGKPNLIILTSKARTASKLVSIVEIAKRELAETGKKCFQYNALSSQMTEIERNDIHGANGSTAVEDDQDASESEDAFETAGAAPQTGKKKRLVPILTTYLCANSVKELKNACG
jgi:hypothetical protein